MNLAARFCRTCGSKILVRNVCHNCRSNPLQGNNYCYDCGALTPYGSKCTNCGANYKTNNKLKLPLLITAALVFIALSAAIIFFLPKADNNNTKKEKQNIAAQEKNIPADVPILQTKSDSIKIDTVKTDTLKTVIALPTTISFFSSQEIRSYPKTCSYFKRNNRDSVLLFFNKQTGYIKINGSIVELKRTKKTADITAFAAGNYEAKVIIDGLSGTSKEWLAAVSIIIKDTAQKTSIKYKLYSACIEF